MNNKHFTWTVIRATISGAVRGLVDWLLETFVNSS
jgi:hypothetical protein